MTALPEIIDNFAYLDDWDDRYRYVIDLGKTLTGVREEDRTADNKVQGCASQVWLKSHVTGDGPDAVMVFDGDSDAHIVRGLVAIVLAIYSGKTAATIRDLDAISVFTDIGMIEHLSAQRANGLRSMIRRIREQAAAVAAKA